MSPNGQAQIKIKVHHKIHLDSSHIIITKRTILLCDITFDETNIKMKKSIDLISQTSKAKANFFGHL